MWELCDQFKIMVRTTKVPAKVFVASSLGFGSNNSSNVQSYIATNNIYKPYGGVASFLWTIYARLTLQTTGGATSITLPDDLSLTELIEDLRSDLQELHNTGQAYFDPDPNNNTSDNMWALRNVVALRAGIDI